ncbi:MAG: chemotaxis protein CheX [Myxococcota bacterium]
MSITREDVESVTSSVWEHMLRSALTPDPKITPEGVGASHVGLIRLGGAFAGLVTLHLPVGMVRGAASVLYGVTADSVSPEQMRDTVAELTNMVGGNLKCLVAPPTHLALPEVYPPDGFASALGSAHRRIAVGFGTGDEGLVVAVYESAE